MDPKFQFWIYTLGSMHWEVKKIMFYSSATHINPKLEQTQISNNRMNG